LDKDSTGDDKENECRIGEGQLDDGRFRTQLLHHQLITRYSKAGQHQRQAEGEPEEMPCSFSCILLPSSAPELGNDDVGADRKPRDQGRGDKRQ
jgi:hypothetical protein